jgi:hypothetical protein
MAVLAVGTLATAAAVVADASGPRDGGELRRALPVLAPSGTGTNTLL